MQKTNSCSYKLYDANILIGLVPGRTARARSFYDYAKRRYGMEYAQRIYGRQMIRQPGDNLRTAWSLSAPRHIQFVYLSALWFQNGCGNRFPCHLTRWQVDRPGGGRPAIAPVQSYIDLR